MCNGAIVGFQKDTPGYVQILVPWHKCASEKDCIAPQGPGARSDRGNHRQDQSILTMLSHKTGMLCTDPEQHIGFKCHQDNRWQNKTFCNAVRDGQVPPRPMIARDIPADAVVAKAKPSLNAPNLNTAFPSGPGMPASAQLPKPQNKADMVLTEECLQKHRPANWPKRKLITEEDPHITHVINPFPTSDVHFSWTVKAIARAHKYALERGLRVETLGISFTDEEIDLPNCIKHLPIIDPTRFAGKYLQSLGIEFGPDELPLRGPIVADVWNAISDLAKSETIIWSNFDLIVREDFYTKLIDINENPESALGPVYKSLAGVSVLRADVLISRDTHPTLDHFTVDDFFAHNNTQKQAGHDCFVFPKHWMPCLDIRHMVFGVGGWDHAIYSQFKQLAHHDEVQFRTLSASHIKPKVGTTPAPPPPPASSPGLQKWIKNSVWPGYGLTRHLGSQVANVKKYWTNPVSWKGITRAIQYASNKRLKYEIEVYITSVRGIKNICKRKYLQKCSGPGDVDVIDGLSSDGRLIGLVSATPARDNLLVAVIELALGLRSGSAHAEDLTNAKRDTLAALITHSPDLLPGPKGPDIFNPIIQKVKRRKGPLTFRAALLFLEEPTSAIEAWYFSKPRGDGDAEVDRIELEKMIKHYNTVWKFWNEQIGAGTTYMEIINLGLDSAGLSIGLLALEEFMQLHRCGRGGSREWKACNGGASVARKQSGRICCALQLVRDPSQWAQPLTARFPSEIRVSIAEQTQQTYNASLKIWQRMRSRYDWPSVAHCCDGE